MIDEPAPLHSSLLAEQNQNLAEAVRLYGQVVRLAREEHSLAARAQYEQGRIYDRLGRKAEAQRAFRAVVRNFPDQSALVALARAKLPPGTPGTDVSIRRVWAGNGPKRSLAALVCVSYSPPQRIWSLRIPFSGKSNYPKKNLKSFKAWNSSGFDEVLAKF